MAVRILFLGQLADIAGSDELVAEAPLDWAGLLALVDADLVERLQDGRINIACAGKLVADKSDLMAQDGDEVAILPPVSGG